MSGAGVLLPSEPLFIVDRSWRVHNNPKTTDKISLDVHALDQLKVSKGAYSSLSYKNVTSTEPVRSVPVTSQEKSDFQFVAASEPGGRQSKDAKNTVRRHARKNPSSLHRGLAATRSGQRTTAKPVRSSPKISDGSNEVESSSKPTTSLQSLVPHSTWSLYGNRQIEKPTGLEDYIQYYHCIISANAYPLAKYAQFDANPMRVTFVPMALADRLFLQTIMMVSILHHASVAGIELSTAAHTLRHRVLMELRSRVANKNVSDTTLLSVSCLALAEFAVGNYSQWHIHDTGLTEMLRLRGGIHIIDSSIRWKIYRADAAGAIRLAKKPMLPRPGSTPKFDFPTLEAEIVPSDGIILTECGRDDSKGALRSIYNSMHHLVNVINRAIKEKRPLNVSYYDNTCICLQYDLLLVESRNAIEGAWKIAGLIFMTTFTRSRPFYGSHCAVLSSKLRTYLDEALGSLKDRKEIVWLAFMGGLASLETKDRRWFIEKLQHIVQICGFCTWSEIKTMLQQILWLDTLHEGPGIQLWEELFVTATLRGKFD